MALPNWSPKPPQWSNEDSELLFEGSTTETVKETLNNIVDSSDKYPIMFPVDTGRCKTLKNCVTEATLERNISSVYPVIHENALELYCKFILFKQQHGSTIEKSLYNNMTLLEFINRLLKKRAVMFLPKSGKYLLLTGEEGSSVRKKWTLIGTDKEEAPLELQNCISYDEIKLSEFLSISSYSYFLNMGNRENRGEYMTERKDIEDEGVIVSMIPPRLNNKYMEYKEIIISKSKNSLRNGYDDIDSASMSKLFFKFYEEPFRNDTELVKNFPRNDERYEDLNDNTIFDNYLYYKRMTISIDTLLMEANYRAKLKDTTAFIYVVGFALDISRVYLESDRKYMDIFAKRMSSLGKNLSSVSDICFAYIKQEKCGDYKNGEIFSIDGHPNSGIKIHIYNRHPHAKLLNEDAGKLLVVSYTSNGYTMPPGNDYWCGKLGRGSSCVSAAASSTQITEIHNSHINPLVKADNLRVVTKDDIVLFSKYREIIRNSQYRQ